MPSKSVAKRVAVQAGARFARPLHLWVSWCQRCGQVTATSTERTDVLSDCAFCPPDTPTMAYEYDARAK